MQGGDKSEKAWAKFVRCARCVLPYVFLPCLFVLCGAMPSVAILSLPVLLVLLYVLYRRLGPYMPLSCIAFYGILSLSLNYDILTVIYFCGLFFAFCGLCAATQLKRAQYLLSVTVAVCFCIAGAFLGVGIVRGAEGRPVGDIAAKYVLAERDDPIVAFFARDYYEHHDAPTGEQKLKPTDGGYDLAAAKGLSEWAKDEFDYYIWYYCIHYGAVLGYVGFFVSAWLNLKKPRGGRGHFETPLGVGEMKLPRAFLWTMALPATVTGMILGIFGGYDALSATVMHAFCSIPAAFGCFTLLAYFSSLFNGKAKIAAHVILVIIGIAAVLFPFALFMLSIFGVCDCILNLRFWTEYIRN